MFLDCAAQLVDMSASLSAYAAKLLPQLLVSELSVHNG